MPAISRRVWKYKIPGEDDFSVEIPAGAQILEVGCSDGPCFWALVQPANDLVTRTFACRPTGFAEVEPELRYIGTFTYHGFVGHLFER